MDNGELKEILKTNISERLETTWNLSMAYPHLRTMTVSMLKDLERYLKIKEINIDSNPKIKSKSGYAIQMIKTYKSIAKTESENQ